MTLHCDPALSLPGNPTWFRACAWVPDTRRRRNSGSFSRHQPSKAAVTLPRVPFSAGSGHKRGLRAVRKAGEERPPAPSAGWHGGRALPQRAHKSPASRRRAQSPGSSCRSCPSSSEARPGVCSSAEARPHLPSPFLRILSVSSQPPALLHGPFWPFPRLPKPRSLHRPFIPRHS